MTSRALLRRKQCEGKVKYHTLADAASAARRVRRRTNDRISFYRCRFCSNLHIGHTPGTILRAIADRNAS